MATMTMAVSHGLRTGRIRPSHVAPARPCGFCDALPVPTDSPRVKSHQRPSLSHRGAFYAPIV
jgi:hypothetical protein